MKDDVLKLTLEAYKKTFSHLISERKNLLLLRDRYDEESSFPLSESEAWKQAERELIEENKLYPNFRDMDKLA